ncbi:MAG TPA: cache domain-containing protein, partial [Burkholderiaceae bacterium]|nr:cache domain-containing protein [Burkholderiaceae bacterium]
MFSTIKNRLIGITIAIVVLTLLASTAATYFTVRGQTLSKVGNDLTELSRAHAAAISTWVRTQKDIVTAMVPVAQATDPVPFLQQAAKSGRLDTAYVGFADKRIVFSSPQTLPPDYDPTSRPWYKLAEAAGAPVVTAPYADAATKRLVMTFALAVKSGGATQGVVASDVFMDEVVKTIQSIKPTPNGFAFLVNKQGVVIAHPNAALSLKAASDISKDLDAPTLARAADGAAAMPAVTVGDAGYLLRAVPVEGTEWMLVSAANRAEALASVTSLLQTAGLVLVLALIAAAIAVTVAISSMLLGLARVRDAMDDIGSGSGDLSKRLPVAGNDEISQIAASFNQFAEKIASVIREMR